MKMMEGMQRGAPATTLAAVLMLSGCSAAEQAAPEEVTAVWGDIEQRLVTDKGPTPLEIYKEAGITEKQISVDTTGLEYGERAAAIANAVFAETSGDIFEATSDGVIGGEHMLSLRLGHGLLRNGTTSKEQLLEAAAVSVCTTVPANGIDIGSNDPIAQLTVAAREQARDAAEEYEQVVFTCIGRLASIGTEEGVELIVPIGR